MKKILLSIFALFVFVFAQAQRTNIPDANFEQALIDKGLDDVIDGSVATDNIRNIEELNISGKGIESIEGIEDFVSLQDFDCSDNNLTGTLNVGNSLLLFELNCSNNNLTGIDISENILLRYFFYAGNNLGGVQDTGKQNIKGYVNAQNGVDLSNNTALEELDCSNNPLISSLDLSSNTALEKLTCNANSITILDLSNNAALTDLSCDDNNLFILNVKNGNNNGFASFSAENNPNLKCVNVDDAANSTANWTNIDIQTSFSEACDYTTYVPDDNFEQALIGQGLDDVLDDRVDLNNTLTTTYLYLVSEGITDLTGIEDFVALETLNCGNNNLNELDVSTNAALIELNCYNNNLNELDVSTNTALEELGCNGNDLTELDVSANTALKELNCYSNELIDLDVSINTALEKLSCYSNDLTDLDLSTNTALEKLFCYSNDLTNLDLGTNTALKELYCYSNDLTNLDLSMNIVLKILDCHTNDLMTLNVKNGNNNAIVYFDSKSNPNLTCIQVDNASYSSGDWTNIDVQTNFSEDCNYALSTNWNETNAFSIYPIPNKGSLITVNVLEDVNYKLINTSGQIIKQGHLTSGINKLNFTNISKGLYFIRIRNNKTFQQKKLILN